MPIQLTPQSSISTKDRFIGFAFATADLLLETDLDGVITFATGAFRSRLGTASASYIGRFVRSLFAPADVRVLDMMIAEITLRGRIAPLVLRLADTDATPTAVAAILMSRSGPLNGTNHGQESRIFFSIGPIPRAVDIIHSHKFKDRSALIVRAGQAG